MDITEQLVDAKRIQDKPKKPTAKQVFGNNISVKGKMSKSYTEEELKKMKVSQLKQLIRDHNLHTTYIKGYSTLKKGELVSSFLKYYKKAAGAKPDPPKKQAATPPKKQAAAPPKKQAAEAPKKQAAESPKKKPQRRIALTMVPKGAPKTGVDVSKGGGGNSKGQQSMDDFVHDLEQRAGKMDAMAKKKEGKQMKKDLKGMTLKPKRKHVEEDKKQRKKAEVKILRNKKFLKSLQ
jgi:hypothetical protein